MKKAQPLVGSARKSLCRSLSKPNKRTAKNPEKKNVLKEVLGFHWLKKAMVGKAQVESLDLLDRWILK